MSIKKMEEMTWKEFDKLDKVRTVVIAGLSPIEEHGPHLPLGTDFIAASDCILEVADYLEEKESKFNYIVHPPFPIGYNENVMNFPGTIFYRSKTVENLLIDFGESLARSGINKIIIINHHLDLGHIKAIDNAREYLLEKLNVQLLEVASRIIYCEENSKENIQSAVNLGQEIHADIRETSFMLYKHPELVGNCYSELEPVYLDMKKFIRSGGKCFREAGITEGYIGSPGNSTAEFGEKQYENMIIETGNIILKFLKGGTILEISSKMKLVMNHMEWR